MRTFWNVKYPFSLTHICSFRSRFTLCEQSPPSFHGLSITNLHLVVDRNIKWYEAELRLPGSPLRSLRHLVWNPPRIWVVSGRPQSGWQGLHPPVWGAPRFSPRGAGEGIRGKDVLVFPSKKCCPSNLNQRNQRNIIKKKDMGICIFMGILRSRALPWHYCGLFRTK